MKPSDSGDKSSLKQMGPYLGLGLELAATLLIFVFLGQYLDKRWDTEPWLFLACVVLGFVIGFFNFFRTISRLTDRNRKGGSNT